MKKRIFVVLAIIIIGAAFYVFDLTRYLALEPLQNWVATEPLQAGLAFGLLYVLVTGLSLPGAGPLSLVAGAVFGLWYGVLIVSFASTIGATIAMLISRTLLQEWVQKRFAGPLKRVNEGVQKDGALYLFTLRLIPPIPFFIINLVFGLTRIPAKTFYWVSQVGMLPATILYVNAGHSLGTVESLTFFEIFSPQILLSFAALIAFPFVVKAIIKRTRFADQTVADQSRETHDA